jgi:serpin B
VAPNRIVDLPTVLTNAVYFKGKFRIPFPREATRPKAFYLADGRERVVPMMRSVRLSGSYRSGKRFEAAVLGYKDCRIALYVLLPARGTSPEHILTEESVQEMLHAQASSSVLDLSMPRFTVDFSSDLRESLTRLGMGIAFQYPGADFSLLGAPPFFIGGVVHKTRLEVDEEGTVAAAATAMVMLGSSFMTQRIERKILVFDRPFAILLRDLMTGTIVFVGVVYEP